MPGEAVFWRNVTVIAIAHVAFLITILYWRNPRLNSGVQPIVWMTAPENESAEAGATATPQSSTSPDALSARTAPAEKEEEDHPVTAIAKSEIELPSETPTATPAPKPHQKAAPETTPSHSKTTIKPTPNRSSKATNKKASPASSAPASHKPKTNRSPSRSTVKEKIGENAADSPKRDTASGTSGHAGGVAENGSSDLNWYGNMLHDRFYREWVQPTTVVAAGAKLSALVKIRIEKDGRISDFKIIRSSGNVVVDESIAAVAKRVTKVDALPAGLRGRDRYEVSINFELNPAQ